MNEYIIAEINNFTTRAKELSSKEKKLEKARQQFVNDFDIKTIANLSKEEYCVGFKKAGWPNYRTFCYRIENELKSLGDMHGASSDKFGVYYGETSKGSGVFEYKYTKKWGVNHTDALINVLEEICNVLEYGLNDDKKSIINSPLSNLFKYKILNTYYPEKYFSIYNEEHAEEFLNELGVKCSKKDNMIDKQRLLLAEKNKNEVSAKWSNYVYMCFLYERINIPSREKRVAQDAQKEADKSYNKQYQYNIGITKEQWKTMLLNPSVFHEENIQLLRDIYFCNNHASTCKNLEIINGVPAQSYNKPVVALARRVLSYTGKKPQNENGKDKFWNVIFWGDYKPDHLFEWKIKPKLVEAMEEAFPDLLENCVNEDMDQKLINDIREKTFDDSKLSGQYSNGPVEKPKECYTKGIVTYKRDRNIALNALKIAGYKCEIDKNHKTFIRKSNGKDYTEPHHLIPMSAQNAIDVSIDVEENIVSLCSNCHNEIHYGSNAADLIKQLFSKRKDLLKDKEIDITIEELLKYY